MNLDFVSLEQHLPNASLQWEGFGQPLLVNFSAITQDEELSPESSLLEGLGRVLDAVVALEDAINNERAALNPPKPAIDIIRKTVTSNGGNPVFAWTVSIECKATSALDNPINPVEE